MGKVFFILFMRNRVEGRAAVSSDNGVGLEACDVKSGIVGADC